MPTMTRLAATTSAVSAVLAIAACGSSSSPSTGSSGSSTVSLAAADFSFNPTQLSVPAGASVTVTLQNTGKVEHSFTLDNGSVSQDADAGETKTVTFTAPQSGTLAFHCKYHPTQMKGTITVGGAGAGGGSSSSSSAGY